MRSCEYCLWLIFLEFYERISRAYLEFSTKSIEYIFLEIYESISSFLLRSSCHTYSECHGDCSCLIWNIWIILSEGREESYSKIAKRETELLLVREVLCKEYSEWSNIRIPSAEIV